MSVGGKIKEYRIKAGLSQEALAERCGVSRQAVTKWEKGRSLPTAANLVKLCRAVGVDTDTFYRAINRQDSTAAPPGFKDRAKASLIIIMIYIIVYIAGRFVCSDMSDKSIIGWLFGTDSRYYLFGWLIHQKIYWLAMAICRLAALAGCFYTAFIATQGAVAGIFIGEIFGPVSDPKYYHYTHNGWIIWIALFLLSLAVGFLADRVKRKRK